MGGAKPSKKLKTSTDTYTPAAKAFLGTFKNKKKPQDKEPSAAATSGATISAKPQSSKAAVPAAADSRASRFDAFDPPLSAATLEALGAHGFETATPVQEATIPRLLRHQDVAVQACTGSGKTLAFLIPLVELLHRREDPLRKHQVGALIIEPTRELAVQVHTVLLQLATRWPQLSVALMVGGTDVNADITSWREKGGHVLVGTPGRLDDLMVRLGSEMLLRELELLVLDEADRLLDMGFEATLNAILQRLPKQRRTGLFSATQTGALQPYAPIPRELLQLVRAGLRNPVKVEVKVRLLHAGGGGGGESGDGSAAALGPRKTSATPSSLSLFYMLCEEEQRLPQLLHFLGQRLAAGQKVMCYFLTCAQVDFYRSALPLLPQLKDAAMGALHGKMAPSNRLKAYEWFVAQKGGALLLCTDVAARGLDIPDVDWIVQFDAPQEPNAFVHRVGRTARMGRQGQALLLLRPQEETYTRFLELRKVPLQLMEPVAGLPSLHAQLQPLLLADRAVMEKANAAYVSIVRAYSEHECKYIFQLAQLDLGALASALALLRLPKLKELRKMHKKGAWLGLEP